MSDETPRFALPLLAAAQAQKEMTHNEALARLDIAVQAVVVSVAPSSIPSSPAVGQCWTVGTGAGGAWAGRDGAIAGWTVGGWRFVAPFPGMAVWSLADACIVRRSATAWTMGSAIAVPTGGATIDVEARAAIGAVIATMRAHGLISAG